jgi:hypothetical protein
MFTRHSSDDPTQHEVLAPTPWLAQLWLFDFDSAFFDPAPTTFYEEPTSVHVPLDVPEESITKLKQFSRKLPLF